MKAFKLPAWTKDLPDHANLMSNDILTIFEYKGLNNLPALINIGSIPKPDGKAGRGSAGRIAKHMWSMGYLRRLELEQDNNK